MSRLGERKKTRNAFKVVLRSSHLQSPALGFQILVHVSTQEVLSGIGQNWNVIA